MSNSKTTVALQVGNILAFVVTLAVNGLASTSILGDKTTAEISDQYSTLITPAGYVFAIWGIIYALLAAFVVYQAMPGKRNNPFQKQISALFIISSLFNIGWIFLWQYGYIALSVAPIAALWVTLAAIYLRLKIGKSDAPHREKACVQLPFSVYFAWITVATAADIAAAASYAGWLKWTNGDAVCGILAALVILAINLVVITYRRDVAFSLVVIWAFAGIAVKQSAIPEIVYTAVLGAVIVAAAASIAVFRDKLKTRKTL
jgi:translocator protein